MKTPLLPNTSLITTFKLKDSNSNTSALRKYAARIHWSSALLGRARGFRGISNYMTNIWYRSKKSCRWRRSWRVSVTLKSRLRKIRSKSRLTERSLIETENSNQTWKVGYSILMIITMRRRYRQSLKVYRLSHPSIKSHVTRKTKFNLSILSLPMWIAQ